MQLAPIVIAFVAAFIAAAHAFPVICEVTRADDGLPLAGALCALYSADGGQFLSSGSTDETGIATAADDVQEGDYQLQVSAAGFYSAIFQLSVADGAAPQRAVLSPIVEQDALRFVLTWAANPSDLDSWLFLPDDSNSSWPCDSVSYSTENCREPNTGAAVSLDVDDTNGYGPETITLINLPSGVYRYEVNIYSGSGGFTASEATVSVYFGPTSTPIATFNAPADTTNSWWHVADVHVTVDPDGCRAISLQPVNSVSDSPGSGSPSGAPINAGRLCSANSSACTLPPVLSPSVEMCGVFGDPHVVLFNRTGVTCRAAGTSTLVENEWFSLLMTSSEADPVTGATAAKAITLIYRQCNAQTLYFDAANESYPTPSNPQSAGPHTITLSGNNYYLDALNTRVQIRYIGNNVVFGISTPLWNDSAICAKGCSDKIDIANISRKRGLSKTRQSDISLQRAQELCAPITDAFAREACVFDLVVTDDESYVQQATVYNTVQSELIIAPDTTTPTSTSTTATTGAPVQTTGATNPIGTTSSRPSPSTTTGSRNGGGGGGISNKEKTTIILVSIFGGLVIIAIVAIVFVCTKTTVPKSRWVEYRA